MNNKLYTAFNKNSLIENLKKFKNYQDVLFAISILGIISVLLFPIPTWLVDFLLSISITSAVLILMTVLFIDKPLDLSAFPTILLVATMLRLSLNIATTRLVLGFGHTGTHAAGYVVEAFGLFVMQGSVIIGVIVFSILTIINFVVITKGSGRIAEVAARFSLDAMPGKQMAIDADLSAGIINEETAKNRRKQLEDESTFFGAMDGANKFVRGDAIASILIIFINFIGGMLIGIIQKGMTFDLALKTYTLLTIGDGLVSQIPALVISIAAGLLVTKSGTSGSADKAIISQLSTHPQAMGISSGLLAFMAIMPGIPATPFLICSTLTGIMCYHLMKNKERINQSQLSSELQKEQASATQHAEDRDENIKEILQLDIIKLELGYEIIPLINNNKLPEQIKMLRKQIAKDLGFVMPIVRMQDNMQIRPHQYFIKIKDMEVSSGEIWPNKLLIMAHNNEPFSIEGEDTIEPAFGLPARWVDPSYRQEALRIGYTVVDAITVIATHLTEVVRDNIVDMLPYSAVQHLLDSLPEEHKKIVADIIPSQISITILHRVLQGLLQEGISIRDFATILEAITEISNITKNIIRIIEHVRLRLSRQICFSRTDKDGVLKIITLSLAWEKIISENLVGDGEEKQITIAPTKLQELMLAISKAFDSAAIQGDEPVLLVSAQIRPYLRMIVERFKPDVTILSQSEIYYKTKVKSIAQI